MPDTDKQIPSPETGTDAPIPVAETTWLEGIAQVQWRQQGDITILSYILHNGHRYTIPLMGQARDLTRRALSPVVIADAGQIPPNGHGTRS